MKKLVRVFALLLALTFVFGMVPFCASAEESSEESSCKVLVWTDANGEHVTPYTDFSGWDQTMESVIGSDEHLLYPAGGGGYSDYYAAGFRGRWISSDERGSVGVAIVQADTSKDGSNAHEVKINNAYSFVWNYTATGGATEYPIKAIIFYNPNSTTDDLVYESIDTTQLKSAWAYDPWTVACHVSGQDGAELYAAAGNGLVSVRLEVREHDYKGRACTVCGAEAPPCEHPNGYDETTGICPDCEGMVPLASVEAGGTKTFYTDFQDALDAWVDGSTLTLLNDIPDGTVAETIEIRDKTVTLDLGGHVLDMSSVTTGFSAGARVSGVEESLTIPGALTIRSSGENGELKAGVMAVSVYDRLTMESGKLAGKIYAVGGITNMTGGSVEVALHSNAVETVKNAEFHISGGTLSGRYAIWNNGTTTVSGSPVIQGQDYDAVNPGAAIANINGTITISGTPVLSGGSLGEMYIMKPITFNTQPAQDTWSVSVSPLGTFAIPGEGMDLDAAKFTSANENCYVVENEDGSLALVECDHTGEVPVYNGDGTHDVTCPCGSTLHQDNAACSGGENTCQAAAVCQVCGGEYGEISDHTFNPATGECLICGEPMAEASLTIARLTTYYQSVQDAANAGFNSRHTVTLCKDVNLSNYLTIHEGCTLDLGGWTLSSDSYMALYVSGSARLTDSSGTGSIWANGTPAWGVWVQGDLVMEKDFPIVAGSQAFYHNSGVLDLTALTAPSSYNVWVSNATDDVYSSILLPEGYIFYSQGAAVARSQSIAAGTELTIAPCYTHQAVENSHNCGLCGAVLGECIDEDTDYICDICGAELEKPKLEGVIRLAGANRWNTALKVADEMKVNLGAEKFDAIIIASGNGFADALAGSYLSTVKDAPILLSWGQGGKFEYLDTDNIDYIKANLAEDGIVYLLGGVSAVPELYETELADYEVVRLGGKDRFETNLLILEEAGVADGAEILVCTSTNFADSLSASATGMPILLVFNEQGVLYGDQPEFLAGLTDCTFTVIGGESAVSAKLATAIEAYGEVTRLAGTNRFETSVLVAQKYFAEPTTAVLAYAWNYPDGLCGGALAYTLGAPLILTMTNYEDAAVEYATETGITAGIVLGGDTLISDEAVRAIFAMAEDAEIIVK